MISYSVTLGHHQILPLTIIFKIQLRKVVEFSGLGYIALEQPCFCKIVIVFSISGMGLKVKSYMLYVQGSGFGASR